MTSLNILYILHIEHESVMQFWHNSNDFTVQCILVGALFKPWDYEEWGGSFESGSMRPSGPERLCKLCHASCDWSQRSLYENQRRKWNNLIKFMPGTQLNFIIRPILYASEVCMNALKEINYEDMTVN